MGRQSLPGLRPRRHGDRVRVVVTGSRGWTNAGAIHRRLSLLPEGSTIIHGRAGSGADWIADVYARQLDFDVVRMPADWDLYGRRAGIVRNIEMLNTDPELVLAFWDGESRGTRHCVEEARKRGIPVEVIRA